MEIMRNLLDINLASQARESLYDLWLRKPQIFKDIFQSENPFNNKYSHEILRKFFSSENMLDDLQASGIIIKDRALSYAACRINVLVTDILESNYPLFICTDPPCTKSKGRTYPFIDDSEYWFKSFDKSIVRNPSLIIDLYYDNGAVGIELARYYKHAKVVGLCKNDRSVIYAKFNAALNGVNNFSAEKWEASTNTPDIKNRHLKADIICAIPPFAMRPPELRDKVFEDSDGGEHGDRITNKLLSIIPYIINENGVFIMTAYSLGKENIESTQLTKESEKKFQKEIFTYHIRHIPSVKLWRLHGEKRFPFNPMNVEYMSSRYFDGAYRDWFGDSMDYSDYVKWIENSLKKNGFTHLHYVYIEVKKESST